MAPAPRRRSVASSSAGSCGCSRSSSRTAHDRTLQARRHPPLSLRRRHRAGLCGTPIGRFSPRGLPVAIIRAFAGWERLHTGRERSRGAVRGGHPSSRDRVRPLGRVIARGPFAPRTTGLQPKDWARVHDSVVHVSRRRCGFAGASYRGRGRDRGRSTQAGSTATRPGRRRRPCPPIGESPGPVGPADRVPTERPPFRPTRCLTVCPKPAALALDVVGLVARRREPELAPALGAGNAGDDVVLSGGPTT